MDKKYLIILVYCFLNLFLSLSVHASEVLIDSIYDVEFAQNENETDMLFLKNGRVLYVDTKKKQDLLISELQNNKKRAQFEVSGRFVISIKRLNFLVRGNDSVELQTKKNNSLLDNFEVSNINSNKLQEIYKVQRYYPPKLSQCFNRAHLWSYKIEKKLGLKTGKIFIFFTKKYIRENKYHWWFHVAPYIHLNSKTIVLDKLHTWSEGQYVKNWSESFMWGKQKSCPEVSVYSEFYDNQEASDCYLMKASMYYQEPRHLKAFELEEESKVDWNINDLRRASKDVRGFFRIR